MEPCGRCGLHRRCEVWGERNNSLRLCAECRRFVTLWLSRSDVVTSAKVRMVRMAG